MPFLLCYFGHANAYVHSYYVSVCSQGSTYCSNKDFIPPSISFPYTNGCAVTIGVTLDLPIKVNICTVRNTDGYRRGGRHSSGAASDTSKATHNFIYRD